MHLLRHSKWTTSNNASRYSIKVYSSNNNRRLQQAILIFNLRQCTCLASFLTGDRSSTVSFYFFLPCARFKKKMIKLYIVGCARLLLLFSLECHPSIWFVVTKFPDRWWFHICLFKQFKYETKMNNRSKTIQWSALLVGYVVTILEKRDFCETRCISEIRALVP